jgi:hypothetical protein
MGFLSFFFAIATVVQLVRATPHAKPFEKLKRQAGTPTSSLHVDLGYAIYEGAANSSTRLNVFKGYENCKSSSSIRN